MPTLEELEELEDDEVMTEFVAGVISKMKELGGDRTCWCICHQPDNPPPGLEHSIETGRPHPILLKAGVDMFLRDHQES